MTELKITYPLRRLRIMLRAAGERHARRIMPEDVDDVLAPHVQHAIGEVECSGNPTQSRTYEIGGGDRLSVYYKPSWSSYWKEVPKDARAGIASHSYRVRYRTWP